MIGLMKNKSQYYTEKYIYFFQFEMVFKHSRIFTIHSRINPFYSRNFTFITQEITNLLLKKFERP